MLFPISDDNPRYTRPYVNYGLIAINVAVYLLVVTGGRPETIWLRYGMKPLLVWREPATLITSMFLHGGFFHLLGNMWFLWIVGDNVEDALGHVWYLGAYLAGGVAANLIHTASGPSSPIPCIGASGAVSAALGFYLVVFPSNRIRVFYWLFWYLVGTFWARAFWVIGAWFLIQLFWALVSLGADDVIGVAYWAHIGGFAFGAGAAGVLRAIWPNVNPHRRRGVFPSRTDRAAEGLASRADSAPIDLGRSWTRGPRTPGEHLSVQLDAAPEDVTRTIEERLAVDDVIGARRAMASFAAAFPGRPLDPRLQLGLVQALERRGDHEASAECLEHFLATQSRNTNAAEAKLALGLIYARHLGRRDRARRLLGDAAVEHPRPDRAALARRELAALG